MNILAEVLSVINVVNINVNTDNADEINEIELKKNQIELIKCNSPDPLVIQLSKGFNLKSGSVNGLQYDGSSWLSFRTLLDEKAKMLNSILEDVLSELPCLSLSSNCEEEDLAGKNVFIQCKCSYSLTHATVLKKFCILPADDFEATSESWFCHCHDKCAVKEHTYNVIPPEDKCFYNEFFYCLSATIFKDIKRVDAKIKCPGCFTDIGFVKKGRFNIWVNEVKWVLDNEVFSKTSSEILINLVKNIEKDCISASTHVLLELENEYLYMSIVDNSLTLLLSSDSPLLSYKQSKIKSNSSEYKKKLKPESSVYQLEKHPSLKLLFKHKTSKDDEVKSWQKNININNFSCNASLLHSIFDLLLDSNGCLPPTLRNVGDLKVGYVLK